MVLFILCSALANSAFLIRNILLLTRILGKEHCSFIMYSMRITMDKTRHNMMTVVLLKHFNKGYSLSRVSISNTHFFFKRWAAWSKMLGLSGRGEAPFCTFYRPVGVLAGLVLSHFSHLSYLREWCLESIGFSILGLWYIYKEII